MGGGTANPLGDSLLSEAGDSTSIRIPDKIRFRRWVVSSFFAQQLSGRLGLGLLPTKLRLLPAVLCLFLSHLCPSTDAD